MHSVTKIFEWSMAHRLIHGYEGKCKNIHGHTYKAEITIGGAVDPANYGFIVDFGVISDTIKDWVMRHLDHATIVDPKDLALLEFLVAHQQKHFVLPPGYVNSTAENIADLLSAVWAMHSNQMVMEIKVWETPTSYATWRCPHAAN